MRLRLFNLSREEAQQMRWRDREEIGERIRNEAEKEFGKVQVFQLQGQDSFEKAVFRSGPKGGKGKGKHGKGIWSTRTHFLVFPRVGASSSVQVPGQMKQRVTVAQDYVDPQPLSSTDIRASAAESSLESKVHPRLLEDVLQMYTRRRRFLLLFLGPPGSGKSSLGRELEKAFGFYHLSGGDAYRAAQSRTSTIAAYRSEGRLQIVAKVMAALRRALHLLGDAPVCLDGVLAKELPDFEGKVGTPCLIIKLKCPAEVLLDRIDRRGMREHEVHSAEQRIRNYFALSMGPRLRDFEDSGLCRELSTDRPYDEVARELKQYVQEAATKHRLLLSGEDLSETGGNRLTIDEEFWHQIFQEIESSPLDSYNLRVNAVSMQERQGSRALKNFNNLVKDVLIHWSVQQVSPRIPKALQLEVFDVASGRGGDQLKFVKAAEMAQRRLCYNAMDISEAQVLEAQKRLRQRMPHLSTLDCARFFIGDVTLAPPKLPEGPLLPWQQVVSIEFALHYAFGSESSARSFLDHATRRLCAGGLLLITTVDANEISKLAAKAREKQELCWENGLLKISFESFEELERIADADERIERFGLRYRFDLAGEGIDCQEYVVPEDCLVPLLHELDFDLVTNASDKAAVCFTELLEQEDFSSRNLARAILTRLGCDQVEEAGDVSVYDRLGLKINREEEEVLSLYKFYVARRREGVNASVPSIEDLKANDEALSQAGDLLKAQPPVDLRGVTR